VACRQQARPRESSGDSDWNSGRTAASSDQKGTPVSTVATFRTENEFGKGEVRSWASLLEDSCRAQAEAISRASIVEGYLALMPDAHFGFGPPVGSALKTRGAVMPYAVGVDIGCGMIAVKTRLERGHFASKEGKVLGHIRELIPSGVGTKHAKAMPQSEAFHAGHGDPPGIRPESRLTNRRGLMAAQHNNILQTALIQFGTLGSGNHFVEVATDAEGTVWLLLHSGSRGIGNQLATAHVEEARAFCKENGIAVESDEFAYVVAGTRQFKAYIADMLWCQEYAYQQREAMMDSLILAVERECGEFEHEAPINCNHNYAEQSEPGLWLTRKGAIDASEGALGIIPGSMGAATYIVRGKGNEESYRTSPHGAGRLLGRNVARKSLDIEAFKAQMAGRTWLDRDADKLLDEAPGAYKPIRTVIADSEDLIEPVHVLSQFVNYKGV
jgi:tRNA-splicing ligase RtcB